MNHPKTSATQAGLTYDDEVLDAGWVPPPEAAAMPAAVGPATPAGAAVDEFLEIVYRSQGSDIE